MFDKYYTQHTTRSNSLSIIQHSQRSNSATPLRAKMSDSSGPRPADTEARNETDTQNNNTAEPERSTHDQTATQPTNFHIRKKSTEEVKAAAAELKPSMLTPGLKQHPDQASLGGKECAAPMEDTPENIKDSWKRDSFFKPEARTPMGSMTVKHIDEGTILYHCGTCRECNTPNREKCKKCKDGLGGEEC